MLINVEESLATLETAVAALARVQRERRQALRRVDAAALESLADQEAVIGLDLHRALAGEIPSNEVADSATAVGNLAAALDRLGPADRDRILARVRSLAQSARAAQVELTSNYFITHRLHQHLTELLEIMSGEEGPAFNEGSEAGAASAGRGVFLDNRA